MTTMCFLLSLSLVLLLCLIHYIYPDVVINVIRFLNAKDTIKFELTMPFKYSATEQRCQWFFKCKSDWIDERNSKGIEIENLMHVIQCVYAHYERHAEAILMQFLGQTQAQSWTKTSID